MDLIRTHSISNKAKLLVTAAIIFVSQMALAVDGVIVKSKSAKSASAFSNMKKNLSLSLNSGFSYRDNRSFGFRKTGREVAFNSTISYQKGNITYILPYKNKSVLHRFKTPEKPAN